MGKQSKLHLFITLMLPLCSTHLHLSVVFGCLGLSIAGDELPAHSNLLDEMIDNVASGAAQLHTWLLSHVILMSNGSLCPTECLSGFYSGEGDEECQVGLDSCSTASEH